MQGVPIILIFGMLLKIARSFGLNGKYYLYVFRKFHFILLFGKVKSSKMHNLQGQ